MMDDSITIFDLLDVSYGPNGDAELRRRLENGADVNGRYGPGSETPLHVATRRRRESAVLLLLDYGADIDAKNRGGKTAFAHAARRGFYELAALLAIRGANLYLNPADRLALAVTGGHLLEAQRILDQYPGVIQTGNPEEDRLLADMAGRSAGEAVAFLIDNGADLTAPALDSGTPLHQAAWFGQPANAHLLLQAGAPVNVFDETHSSSPLGWAVHGSRYSGGAERRQAAYVELVKILLEAGSSLSYPDQEKDNAYLKRLMEDASPAVRRLLEGASSH
jgi:ankyrin repeat protein